MRKRGEEPPLHSLPWQTLRMVHKLRDLDEDGLIREAMEG